MSDVDVKDNGSGPTEGMDGRYGLTRLVEDRARQDAALLADRLRRGGLVLKPGNGGICPPFVPGVVKLAMACRLAQWEGSGIRSRISDPLPPAAEVFRDIREADGQERYPVSALASSLLQTWLTHLAWKPLGDGVADVLVTGVDADDSMDLVAELLWQFRHLMPTEAK